MLQRIATPTSLFCLRDGRRMCLPGEHLGVHRNNELVLWKEKWPQEPKCARLIPVGLFS